MQHHPDGKDQRLSHRDADKWRKRNNSELYTKFPSAIAQRSTQIVGQEWKAFFAALSAFKKTPSAFKARPQNHVTPAKRPPCTLVETASSVSMACCILPPVKTQGTLAIGYNKHWKQGVNIGRVNNQKFVGIPHATLISQIQYKCQSLGITTVIQEESYTSRASALDNDVLPVYGERPKNVVSLFSGKRIRRGLHQSKHGIVNVDINGALNILRKATGEALGLACKGCVSSPIMMDLMPHKSVVIKRENAAHQNAA
jgi:IS605 OrfB family transposase